MSTFSLKHYLLAGLGLGEPHPIPDHFKVEMIEVERLQIETPIGSDLEGDEYFRKTGKLIADLYRRVVGFTASLHPSGGVITVLKGFAIQFVVNITHSKESSGTIIIISVLDPRK